VTKLWAVQSKVGISGATWDFSLLQNVQTSCRAHPLSYSVGSGGSFSG